MFMRAEETIIREILPVADNQNAVVFCVTLYNEHVSELLRTIISIYRSVADFRGGTTNVQLHVVADGADRLHPTTWRLFAHAGFMEMPDGENIAAFRWSTTLHKLEQHLAPYDDPVRLEAQTRLPSVAASNGRDDAVGSTRAQNVETVFHIKKENAGKIDSHRYFFEEVCKKLHPQYVVQVDTGSCLARACFGELMLAMERNPDLGAVAGHLVIEPGAATSWRSALLNFFQFNHFLDETTVRFPIPLLFGRQEVFPGACSMMRWAALTATGQAASGAKNRAPLDVYLAGASQSGLFEANAHLAEDRLIAAELMGRPNATWRGGLAPKAVVVVDPCERMFELMQQRRRWMNSTTSVRLRSVVHALTHSSQRLAPDQAGIALTLMATNVATIGKMLLPAITILLVIFIATVLGEHFDYSKLPVIAAIITGILWLIESFLSFRDLDSSTVENIALPVLLANAVFIGIGLICAVTIGLYAMPDGVLVALALSVGAGLLSVLSTSRVDRRYVPAALLRMPLYLPIHLAFNRFLQTYSYARFGDSSWGTKGLNQSTRKLRPSDKVLLRSIQATFFAGNVALIAGGLMLDTDHLGIVLLLIILSYSTLSILGALFGARYFFRHTSKALTRSSSNAG